MLIFEQNPFQRDRPGILPGAQNFVPVLEKQLCLHATLLSSVFSHPFLPPPSPPSPPFPPIVNQKWNKLIRCSVDWMWCVAMEPGELEKSKELDVCVCVCFRHFHWALCLTRTDWLAHRQHPPNLLLPPPLPPPFSCSAALSSSSSLAPSCWGYGSGSTSAGMSKWMTLQQKDKHAVSLGWQPLDCFEDDPPWQITL